MSDKAVVVFTAKSVERILREGGTASWRLHRINARRCAFAVCTRNAHVSNGAFLAAENDLVEGPEAHRSAFLIGRISDVVRSPEYLRSLVDEPQKAGKSRYLIQFNEYAQVNIPEIWKGDRNPVKYATLEELGIDPSMLKWEPMPPAARESIPEVIPVRATDVGSLTMAQAKSGLAQTFGVRPEAIEITIRG